MTRAGHIDSRTDLDSKQAISVVDLAALDQGGYCAVKVLLCG